MAAAYEAVLLDSIRQELRSTQRKSDLRKQLRQQRLPLVPVVMDPSQHRLKHLHRYSTHVQVRHRLAFHLPVPKHMLETPGFPLTRKKVLTFRRRDAVNAALR